MRRVVGTAVLGGLLAALVAGCANPAGVDGDLTNDWKAQPEAQPFVPESNVCHLNLPNETNLSRTLYNPLDCADSHQFETVHVGQFGGADAERGQPPEPGSTEARTAFTECDAKASEYLGGDWRGGRLDVVVFYPSTQAWSGGSRWFRCDIAEIESLDSGDVKRRTGPLGGVFKQSSPIAYGCFKAQLNGNRIRSMDPVACTTAHGAEYAGVWTAPETSFADFQKNTQRAHTGCRGVVAKWAKVPNDSNIQFRTGTIIYYPTADEWADGNRGVQCFLWVSGQNLRRSMKDAGPNVLRIR
ncbi:septum formation family protein [Phytohabitans kaempferiae]|uniref:Septum formation family protein n=1 Tax=Phytohabitans kaempferiae TaxID=1620943 RepID=A0ABV6M1V4_9ACTN